MAQIPGGAVRTVNRPLPAFGSAEIIRDLDLNKYLFWADTLWTDAAGTSVNTAPFVQTPPLLGPAQVGQPITCPSGSWAGFPVPTFSYQWLLEGVAIPGATSATYTPTLAVAARGLSCMVTATNSAGTKTFTTNPVLVAQANALISIAPVPFAAKAPKGTNAATINILAPGAALELSPSNGLFQISGDQSAIQVGAVPLAAGDYQLVVNTISADGRTTTQTPVTVTAGGSTPVPTGGSLDFSDPANSGLHPAI